ncbi:MAG: hypothetical protein ACJA0Q_000472 [Saprospiraceae bacterium]|jgi:hypothetical protein
MKKTLLLLSFLLVTNIVFGKKYIAKFEFNGNAKDHSGKINTVVHGATLTSDRHGQKNKAYQFDGINDFIEIPKGLLNIKDGHSFSVEMYVLMEKNSGTWTDDENQTHAYLGGYLFSLYGAPSGSKELLLMWHNNNTFSTSHRTEYIDYTHFQKVSTPSDNLYGSYHHIVLVRNGKKQKMSLFVDGELVSSVKVDPAKKIEDYPAFIGSHNLLFTNSQGKKSVYNSLFFKGKMDYFRIHNRALSERRIKKMYRRETRTPYKHEYKNRNECKAHKGRTDKINASINVYPNPSRGNFKITADIGIDCKEIRIYNHHGKVVFRSSFKREINADRLKPGYYTIVFITPHRNYKRRLVIIR